MMKLKLSTGILAIIILFMSILSCKKTDLEDIDEIIDSNYITSSIITAGLKESIPIVWHAPKVDNVTYRVQIDSLNTFSHPFIDTTLSDTVFIWRLGEIRSGVFYTRLFVNYEKRGLTVPVDSVIKIVIKNSPPSLKNLQDTVPRYYPVTLIIKSEYPVDSYRVRIIRYLKGKKYMGSFLKVATPLKLTGKFVYLDTIIHKDTLQFIPRYSGMYFINVSAINDFESPFSDTYRIYVEGVIPLPVYPSGGENIDGDSFTKTVEFIFSHPGRMNTLFVSKDREFNYVIDSSVIEDSVFNWEVKEGGKLYWRVCADGCGPVDSFVLDGGVPIFTTPSSDSLELGFEDSVSFSWSQVDGASYYRIQIATDYNFLSIIEDTQVTKDNFVWNLPYSSKGMKIYARIRASNGVYNSPWTSPVVVVFNGSSPTIIYPAQDDEFIFPESIRVKWNEVNGATMYEVFLRDSMDNTIYSYTTESTELNIPWEYGEGRYSVVVRAQNEHYMGPNSQKVYFNVIYPAPSWILPSDTLIQGFPENIEFQWTGVNNATYVIEVSPYMDFHDGIIDTVLDENYRWSITFGPYVFSRLKACRGGFCSAFSTIKKVILSGDIPVINPLSDTIGFVDSMYVSWTSVKGDRNYALQVSRTPFFSDIYFEDTLHNITSSYIPIDAPGSYYVRVKASNGIFWGAWSQKDSFRAVPPRAYLISPQNDTFVGFFTQIELIWHSIKGTVNYELEVSDVPDFSSLADDIHVMDTVYLWNLPDKGTFYFRVKPAGRNYEGYYSDVRSFTVRPPAPLITSPYNNSSYAVGDNINITWTRISGATQYTGHITTESGCGGIIISTFTTQDTAYIFSPSYEGDFYICVKGENSVYSGPFSAPVHFHVFTKKGGKK